MATLSALAARYATEERPVGNLLDDAQILAQALAAARMYAGFSRIVSQIVEPPAIAPSDVVATTEISVSEWAVIRPLFLLYVERENAIQLEASRGFGIDPYGRQSSEVASDILQYEEGLPLKAFYQDVTTI
mgnify:FL=1